VTLGISPPCHNPFMINIAQLVECVHSIYDSLALIDRMLARDLEEDDLSVTLKAGRGVGIVEAPRGFLLHDYTYDEQGLMTKANCVIPTNQNVANIQGDFWKITPTLLDKGKEKIAHTLEMLVRAYDPCISCSTHMLNVEFVE